MQFFVRSMSDNFNYKYVNDLFLDQQLEKYKKWIYDKHDKNINSSMTIKLNSEWITRSYLSSKMILSATVMLTSLEYAIEKNLKMTVPYLSYYSLLTCCRALLYVNPHNEWKKNNNFLTMNHSKIINLTKDYLDHLDKDYASKVSIILNDLKDSRELFSYQFPSSGLNIITKYSLCEIVEICGTLAEMAQLSSELIQKYTFKRCKHNYDEWSTVDLDYLKDTYSYNGLTDLEDWRRVDYIRRKQAFPVSIYYTMTEGMVEDYFGTWCPDDHNNDSYNPDVNWRLIFPVP